MQGVFDSHAKYSWEKRWMSYDPNKDKAATENEWMNAYYCTLHFKSFQL